MSVRKLIKIRSTSSRSPEYKQKCLTSTNFGLSSVDTYSSNQINNQTDSYCISLVEQIKKLSNDNDRLWKLLVQNTDQHQQCGKIQKKIKMNLQCAEKQLSMIKDMYHVERSNYQQSKIFYQKRQSEWQQIVSQLKQVINDYQQTKFINFQKTSSIFNQTEQMKLNSKINLVQSQLKMQKYNLNNLNIYQIEQNYNNQSSCTQKNISQSANLQGQRNDKNQKTLLNLSKSQKNISFNRDILNNQLSSKKQRNYYQQLTKDDLFERALRRTYIKFLTVDKLKTNKILQTQHMQKLKNAKSSTRQRLNKTVRKSFIYDSNEQLEEIIKYIQDKVYDKYKIVRGDFVFQFLKEKFIQCEQIYFSTNSIFDKLDKEPSNYENNKNNFLNKIPQVHIIPSNNIHDKKDSKASTPIRGLQKILTEVESQLQYTGLLLNLNSNIKPNKQLYNRNNHIKNSIILKHQSQKQLGVRQIRDQSKKNIYTQKRLSRRKFIEQKSKGHRSRDNQESIERTRNLSSLIGVNDQYDLGAFLRKC